MTIMAMVLTGIICVGLFIFEGVVKTLHLLRHYKFAVVTTYLSTPHSIKFVFLE